MSEENIGGEDSIIDERRKKLEILRKNNKAYINDFQKIIKDKNQKFIDEQEERIKKARESWK